MADQQLQVGSTPAKALQLPGVEHAVPVQIELVKRGLLEANLLAGQRFGAGRAGLRSVAAQELPRQLRRRVTRTHHDEIAVRRGRLPPRRAHENAAAAILRQIRKQLLHGDHLVFIGVDSQQLVGRGSQLLAGQLAVLVGVQEREDGVIELIRHVAHVLLHAVHVVVDVRLILSRLQMERTAVAAAIVFGELLQRHLAVLVGVELVHGRR